MYTNTHSLTQTDWRAHMQKWANSSNAFTVHWIYIACIHRMPHALRLQFFHITGDLPCTVVYQTKTLCSQSGTNVLPSVSYWNVLHLLMSSFATARDSLSHLPLLCVSYSISLFLSVSVCVCSKSVRSLSAVTPWLSECFGCTWCWMKCRAQFELSTQ